MFTSFSHGKIARFGSGATILRSATPLDDDALRAAAPSVFADSAHGSRSGRYTHIPTSEVLAGLRKEGFEPFEVRQGGSKDDEKRGFTKHMLRLRHRGAADTAENKRELVLLNAHDGTSSYQLMSGVFRMVCSNGLIAAVGEAQLQRVAHKGDVVGQVIEGAYRVIDDNALVLDAIEAMKDIELTQEEAGIFASAALQLRYKPAVNDNGVMAQTSPVQADSILRANRAEDRGNDLWRTFNRAQENLMRGGAHYVHHNAAGERSRRTTRPVNGIDGTVSLNRDLWKLTEHMQAFFNKAA